MTGRVGSGSATVRVGSGSATVRVGSGSATVRVEAGGATVRVEAGGATVLTVAGAAVVVLVLAGVLLVTATVRDIHRARAAADLAALAAAGPLPSGGHVDCGAAGSVAGANGAVLTGCGEGVDGSVSVTVTVARVWPRRWEWLPHDVVARARAGILEPRPP